MYSLYIRLARSNYEISYNNIQVSRNTADYNQKSNTSTEILMEMNLPSVINGTGRVHKDKGHYQKDQKEHMTKLLNEPSLIAEYKNDPRGKEAFDYYKNYHQSLVSEFYDDTGKKGDGDNGIFIWIVVIGVVIAAGVGAGFGIKIYLDKKKGAKSQLCLAEQKSI